MPHAICKVLEEAGIDMVFGVPGGKMGMVYNALYDYQSSIRSVLTRHESLAGVMAEVYGRLTGKPGVVIGQGLWMLANASLGILEAQLSSSPLLVLTDLTDGAPYSHHAPYQAGTGDYGTWNAKEIFGAFTKYTAQSFFPAQAVQHTQLAIKHALAGERGPAVLLYHTNALNGTVGPGSEPRLYPTQYYIQNGDTRPNPDDVTRAAKLLLEAQFPMIIAGNGVRIGQAYKELENLAALLGSPVVTTAGGKGVFPETNQWSLGVMGNFGLPAANAALAEADVVLVVGSKLGPTDTANEHPDLINPMRQKLIHIDIEPKNASWTFPAEQVLIGDAAAALNLLAEAIHDLGAPPVDEIQRRLERVQAFRTRHGFFDVPEMRSDQTPIMPQRVIKEIQQAIADDAIVTCDAGENRIFMTHYFQTKAPNTFLQSSGIGGMGYGIPAALGAKAVFPDRQVVAVVGDGGFAMSMNGLLTAREENFPIVVVVLNNRSLGWVKHGLGERAISSDFQDFDHAAIARSMGVGGVRVERPGELGDALRTALTSGEPYLIDVAITDQETFRKVTSPLVTAARQQY